jgi:hypothetical protein
MTLRVALIVSGAAVAAFAFLMDKLGLGQPGGFGSGQFILLVIGLLGALAGVLGKRIVGFYKGTAIVLLNTLLLFAILELLSIAAFRSGLIQPPHEARREAYLDLPYYESQDWSRTYWSEAYRAESYRYEPYVLWRHSPFQGEVVNINERGLRRTPGSQCGPDSYSVFTFGGSSMWGWGAPDRATIAAHLQRGLRVRLGRPVCVTNYGEDAYVSTQEVVALMRELQHESIPDAVVFYDGVNDVFSAYQTHRADAHLNVARIASKLEASEQPSLLSLGNLRLVALLRSIVTPSDPMAPPVTPLSVPAGADSGPERLASMVVQRYLGNYEIVQALARDRGFEAFFFWQPHLAVQGKNLTDAERAIRSELDPRLIRLTQLVYEKVRGASAGHERLYYIADALDTEESQVWIDAWGHITPPGNKRVASRMLEVLETELLGSS